MAVALAGSGISYFGSLNAAERTAESTTETVQKQLEAQIESERRDRREQSYVSYFAAVSQLQADFPSWLCFYHLPDDPKSQQSRLRLSERKEASEAVWRKTRAEVALYATPELTVADEKLYRHFAVISVGGSGGALVIGGANSANPDQYNKCVAKESSELSTDVIAVRDVVRRDLDLNSPGQQNS